MQAIHRNVYPRYIFLTNDNDKGKALLFLLSAPIISLSNKREEDLKRALNDTSLPLVESPRRRYWPNSETADPLEGNGSWQEAAAESNRT